MKRLGHVPALDGVRGIAILLVVGRHFFLTPVEGGYGVDLFFVLSGFLIVSLFLEGRWPTLRSFYGARARRLLPALLVMLAVYATISLALGEMSGVRSVAVYGFYTANVFTAWFPHITGWVGGGRQGLGGLWSLAQEEQFYLVAPLLILLVVKVRDERWLKRILIGLALLVIAERTALWLHGASTTRLYDGPDTHADGLLIGAILAVSIRQSARPRRFGELALPLLILVTLVRTPWPVTTNIVNLTALAVIACVVTVPESPVTKLVSIPPLRFMGRISYSLYLWQAALIVWLHADANGPAGSYSRADAVGGLFVAIAAAWLSYRLVEQPWRRRRSDEHHAEGVRAGAGRDVARAVEVVEAS